MRSFVGLVVCSLVVAGCSSGTEPELSYEGRSTISQAKPVSIAAVVTVRNIGSATTDINIGNCPLLIAGFTNPERAGTPAWTAGGAIACTAEVRLLSLAPGDYYDYRITGTVPANVQNGRYYLAMEYANPYGPVPIGHLDLFQ